MKTYNKRQIVAYRIVFPKERKTNPIYKVARIPHYAVTHFDEKNKEWVVDHESVSYASALRYFRSAKRQFTGTEFEFCHVEVMS